MAIEKKVRREVTEEDLELNPKLVEKGVKVGDVRLLPPLAEEDEDVDDEDNEDEEESFEDEDDSEEDEQEEEEEVKSQDNPPITFKIRNPNAAAGYSFRTFTRKEHGKNYKDVAASFELANTHKKVVDLTDKDEVAAAEAHNREIKHPIIIDKKTA